VPYLLESSKVEEIRNEIIDERKYFECICHSFDTTFSRELLNKDFDYFKTNQNVRFLKSGQLIVYLLIQVI
jgi:hypothetical protein